ncbi:MAG TPA: helix-turn-helix transcriptional regulator [Candidatus Atribacteria bacterium]|nr:helix-turn-helix transcriptional regulator [Candidatus Atribacteria bacterium]
MSNTGGSTAELMRMLSTAHDIGYFLEDNKDRFVEPDFTACLNELLREKRLTIAQVVARSGMSQSYCYQVFKGIRMPSRDKIIQIGIGMGLSLSEVNKLLRTAGKLELYCKYKRDAVIIFAINNKLTFMDLEELLYEKGLDTLSDY